MRRAEPDQRVAGELGRLLTHRDELRQPSEDPPRGRRHVVAQRVAVARPVAAVHPSAVAPAQRVVGVRIVVELCDLVAEVEERDATRRQRQGVRQHDTVFAGRVARLDAGERGRRAGDARVTGGGVLLKGHPARERAVVTPRVEAVQELPVPECVDAERPGILIGEGPPDVVVRTHVIHPRRAFGQGVAVLQGVLQQAPVARREGLPGERHLQRVVRQLALAGRDVGHDLVGVHDGLRLEHHAGGGEGEHRVERPKKQVRLGQRLARGAEPLPDERDRVHPQHFDALVREEQHLAGHRTEHRGVRVVEVPLVVVERRPDPAAVLELHERARVVVGKDLARGQLVGIRHLAIGEDQVEILEPVFARDRLLRPLVLVARVVEDEVENERDARRTQVGREFGQLRHRAEARVHAAIARHGVAAVVVALGRVEQRHEVQVGEPQLAEVRDLLADAFEVARIPVDVADAAQHPLRLEPAGLRLALRVAHLQLEGPRVPCGGCRGHRLGELLLPIGARAVELGEEAVQSGELDVESGEECIVDAPRSLGGIERRDAVDLERGQCGHEGSFRLSLACVSA